MNTRYLLINLVWVAVMAGLVWQWYESRQREEQLRQQLAEMQAQVVQLQEQVGSLRQEVQTLDESSVEGLVRDANEAILQGWEALVDTVENELKKAREALKEEPDSENDPQPPQPPPETPDGKIRT